MNPHEPLDALEGTLEKVRFRSDDEAWAVADLALPPPPGRHFGEVVTIVGNIMAARPGEWLSLKGHWRRHKDHGRQFEVKEAQPEAPVTAEGIEIYLANSKGIGKKLAKRLIDHFGPETLDVIDTEPQRLGEVEGIGKKRRAQIIKVWESSQAERRIELFLYSHGISRAYAARVRKVYGDQTIERIQANPYRLARDIWGIGFRKADAVASKMGIEGDDPRRVQAGLLQVLREAQSDGHLYLPMELLVGRASEYLKVQDGHIRGGIEELQREDRVVLEPVPDDEDAAGEGHMAVYSRVGWDAERGCTDEMLRLLEAQRDGQRPDGGGAPELDAVEAGLGVSLAPLQKQAITMAFENRVLVITGGPGTGKTTLVRAICQTAADRNLQIALAAPTGRAARRLSEATGQSAGTLHRMLEFSFKAGGFQRNRENPLEADLMVVDEASMIDIFLMRSLLQAVPTQCTLVFVGDVDQLPSVGPGDVLSDLINSGVVPVCRLTTVFRQSQESGIVTNAHRINRGEFPQGQKLPKGQLADFYVLRCADAQSLRAKTLKVVTERIPKAFGFDPTQDIQVIAPMHRGPLGCKSLNEELQESLNPELGLEARRGQRTFRTGDRVMQLRNNYDKEVFNGDVGTVTAVLANDDEERAHGIEVDMDGRLVTYEYEELDELNLAYAITAHKSQGSEYPAVVIPLATAHYVLLERNLLYTALTRAKKLAILVVMEQALARAVKNVTARARFTRLAARLILGR